MWQVSCYKEMCIHPLFTTVLTSLGLRCVELMYGYHIGMREGHVYKAWGVGGGMVSIGLTPRG